MCIDRILASRDVFTTPSSLSAADVNSKGLHGETALHKDFDEGSRFEAWLVILLERDDVLLNLKGDSGIAPLIAALSVGVGEVVA